MVTMISSVEQYDQILRENTAVFADFYADWCGPCKMVGPLVEKVASEVPGVQFVKVNVDQFPQIAQRYGIMSIPTLIAFKGGQIAEQAVGFQSEEALKNMLTKIA